MATALNAALWMVEEINAKGMLRQKDAASAIADEFGREFVFLNENGNLAIKESVLKHFRTMTEGEVVWAQDGFYWREKKDDDPYDERRVHL